LFIFTPGGLLERVDHYGTPHGGYLGLSGPTLGLILFLIGLAGLLALVALRGSVTHARLRVRRFLVSLAMLLFLIAAFLICFMPGGVFNPIPGHGAGGILLDRPGPILGFCFVGAGAITLIVAWSITPPRG
jgi:hypothetical protein